MTYIRPLLQTFGEALHAQRQSLSERRIFNDQNAGIQIRFGLTLHVTDLLKHSKRACNQNKRSQELNNNQRLSDPVASLSVQQFTAHNLRRTDSDHQPGRIKPYNQRTDDNHSGYNPPESGLHKYVCPEALPCPAIDKRQEEFQPAESYQRSQQVHETGLKKSLDNNLTARSTKSFTEPELPSTLQKAGYGQVQGICPTYQQQNGGHYEQNKNCRPASFHLFLVCFLRSKVNVFQRDQFYSPGFMFQCISLVLVGYVTESLFNFSRSLSGHQADVSIYTVNVPDVLPFLGNRIVGKQEIVAQVRTDRHIGNNARYFKVLL